MSRPNPNEQYESFDHLEAGTDYTAFELTRERHSGEPYTVPLSEPEAERAATLLSEELIFSLHDHLTYLPEDMAEYTAYTSNGRLFTAYEAFDDLPLSAVFFPPLGSRTWLETVEQLGHMSSDWAHHPSVIKAETIADVERAHEQGKIACILAVEHGNMIESDLDRIDILHGIGVRTMGLTYSTSNALGTGLKEATDGGLTYFGRDAVARMNKVGIVIDGSHASDKTILDACEVTEDPMILSHDGARGLWDIPRLDPDECLEAVAETGGVIGVQAAPHNTASPSHPRASVESVMDHFEYIVDLVGIDHVTFGPDTLYGDHVALHRHFGKSLEPYPDEVVDIDYVKGMENPSEAWQNIVRALVSHGYSDSEIRKIVSGNTMRVCDEVW